jgi:hypothetical protein
MRLRCPRDGKSSAIEDASQIVVSEFLTDKTGQYFQRCLGRKAILSSSPILLGTVLSISDLPASYACFIEQDEAPQLDAQPM